MVSRTDSIGPLLAPTAAPQPGDPMLNPTTFSVPSFHLEAHASTPGNNVYDLIYDDTGEYVAMTSSGQIILVGASTGRNMAGTRVTTIFNVDCFGILTVYYSGSWYEWVTDGQSSRLIKSTTQHKGMKALPAKGPEVVLTEKLKREIDEGVSVLMAKEKMKRQTRGPVNTDDNAPQCPQTPNKLVNKFKWDYELGEGNFCENGAQDWWKYSPFEFEIACGAQSLCYDMCSGKKFAFGGLFWSRFDFISIYLDLSRFIFDLFSLSFSSFVGLDTANLVINRLQLGRLQRDLHDNHVSRVRQLVQELVGHHPGRRLRIPGSLF